LEARKGKEEKTWLEVGGLRLEAKKNKGGKIGLKSEAGGARIG